MSLSLTQEAAKRLETLRAKQGKERLYLRVTVDGGGCQGFEYKFSFEDTPGGDEFFTEEGSVGVVTDSVSYGFLQGSTLDYEDALIGAKFVVKNPNASSSCGCGTSFNVT